MHLASGALWCSPIHFASNRIALAHVPKDLEGFYEEDSEAILGGRDNHGNELGAQEDDCGNLTRQ